MARIIEIDRLIHFLFLFKGRINFHNFKKSYAILVIVLFVLTIPSMIYGYYYNATLFENPYLKPLELAAVSIFIYSSIALIVKRLHDRNLSGWWAIPGLVLFLFVQFIGAELFHPNGEASGEFFDVKLFAVFWISGLVWFILTARALAGRSSIGPNKYGPPDND